MRIASFPALQTVYLCAAIRAAEGIAMSRFGLDEDYLMARAGLAAWRLVLERWPQAQRIGVACGPGNNGGDGYVLAALALLSLKFELRIAMQMFSSRHVGSGRARVVRPVRHNHVSTQPLSLLSLR